MMLESGGIMLCHAKIVLGKKQLEAQWAEPVSLTCRTNQYGSHRRPSIDALVFFSNSLLLWYSLLVPGK
jgi:hypothetical protein